MLSPYFGAINLLIILAGCSAVFAVIGVVLYLFHRRKVGRILAILTGVSFFLLLLVYWAMYGFTWFG